MASLWFQLRTSVPEIFPVPIQTHTPPTSTLLCACPWEADLGGFNQWSPVPSGSWLGSNNGEPEQEMGRWEEGETGVFIPLPPPCWASVGWLSPSTQGHSSCQVELSTQYSVSRFWSPLFPLSLQALGEVTELSYYQSQGIGLSLWFPHTFVNSSFIKRSSNCLI